MPCITHETPAERAEAERRHREAITGPLHREIDALKHRLAARDAMLCGVLTALDHADNCPYVHVRLNGHPSLAKTMVNNFWNNGEVGVSWDDLRSWWEDHKRHDEERRSREAEEREAKRAKALKKLTHEERVLLGLDGKIVG